MAAPSRTRMLEAPVRLAGCDDQVVEQAYGKRAELVQANMVAALKAGHATARRPR